MAGELYGFNRSNAETLCDLIRERRSKSLGGESRVLIPPKGPNLRAYLLEPLEDIPAATQGDYGGITKYFLGSGSCYILRRVKDGDDQDRLIYQRDIRDARVTRTLYNPTRQTFKAGTPADPADEYTREDTEDLILAIQDTFGDLFALPLNRLLWAKAQSDWEENGTYPNGDPRVSVKRCDRDGGSETGDEFYVYLPRGARSVTPYEHDADPAIFEDFVLGYTLDCEGTPICMTPYLYLGKIKDVKFVGATDTIPPGWHECDGSSQTGNAGTFDLLDFIPGSGIVGNVPKHKQSGDAIGDYVQGSHTDTVGQYPGGQYAQAPVDGWGECEDGMPGSGVGHYIHVGWKEWGYCVGFFIQRYK